MFRFIKRFRMIKLHLTLENVTLFLKCNGCLGKTWSQMNVPHKNSLIQLHLKPWRPKACWHFLCLSHPVSAPSHGCHLSAHPPRLFTGTEMPPSSSLWDNWRHAWSRSFPVLPRDFPQPHLTAQFRCVCFSVIVCQIIRKFDFALYFEQNYFKIVFWAIYIGRIFFQNFFYNYNPLRPESSKL